MINIKNTYIEINNIVKQIDINMNDTDFNDQCSKLLDITRDVISEFINLCYVNDDDIEKITISMLNANKIIEAVLEYKTIDGAINNQELIKYIASSILKRIDCIRRMADVKI